MDSGLLEQGLGADDRPAWETVFVFLTCLVFATSAMSVLVRHFHPEVIPAADQVTEEEVAAISAAIIQHRQKQSESPSDP